MINYKTKALWEHTEQIIIPPSETLTIDLPRTIKTAAKSLCFTQEVVKNRASEYQYSVKSAINCKICYVNDTLKNENFTVLFNRDIEEVDGVFTNSTILNLQGNDVESILITITNNHDTDTLTLNSLHLFESDDIQITTIAKVLQEDTIVSDLIHATSIIADDICVQELETNLKSRDARIAKAGDEVHWIRISGSNQDYGIDILGSEQEQLIRTVLIAGQEYTYSYWYTRIEGDDAYKYLTTRDPRENHPDMPDSERDKFRYMVLKPETSHIKKATQFALDELGFYIPTDIYGAGTDNSGQGNGQGFIYKNANGFYHIYQKSNGEVCGIVMDEDGVHITGWADQHLESIVFKDNGVKLKFTGEAGHAFEYVFDDSENLTGLLQDSSFLTHISYEEGTL